MAIANVALSNTFNQFRSTTNDVIAQVNELYAVTGVTPGTYGSSILVPVITVTNQGRVTSIANVSVGGVGQFNYHTGNANFQIITSSGTSFLASIGQRLDTSANVIFNNLTATGNVTFTGNVTSVTANNLVVQDNLIQIGKNNDTDVVDLGFIGHYKRTSDNVNAHAGLFRDASDGIWKFFDNYPIEPGTNTNIDTANSQFRIANLTAHNITSNGIFYGVGSGLTTLNASNVSSGTLSNARTTASSSNGASTIVARDASGSFTANNITVTDLNSTSDIRLKDNVIEIDNALETITKLSGIKFNWKDTGKISYGLSAQDVEKIIPDIVMTRNDGNKGINYLNIIAFLIESIKALNEQIEKLKSHK
ncbi:tail fiber domain-containing protein [bacterium]|nr:tail fiber domain-containing protein [bacterium]